jgi:hypothetical protein
MNRGDFSMAERRERDGSQDSDEVSEDKANERGKEGQKKGVINRVNREFNLTPREHRRS